MLVTEIFTVFSLSSAFCIGEAFDICTVHIILKLIFVKINGNGNVSASVGRNYTCFALLFHPSEEDLCVLG